MARYWVRGSVSPSAECLEQYWSTSKCRAESWSRMLKAYATLADGTSREDFDTWIQIRAALDEIFTSEMLTRVWMPCSWRATACPASRWPSHWPAV